MYRKTSTCSLTLGKWLPSLSLSLHVCKMGVILRRLVCRGACRSPWNVAAAWNTLSIAVLMTESRHLCDATACPSRAVGARPLQGWVVKSVVTVVVVIVMMVIMGMMMIMG